VTLNGGSKTTVSLASTTKIPVNLPPIPAQRRSLIPPPVSYYSENPININSVNKDQNSSSKATCCFFKCKSKHDIQVT
jgi:hypothetical protein